MKEEIREQFEKEKKQFDKKKDQYYKDCEKYEEKQRMIASIKEALNKMRPQEQTKKAFTDLYSNNSDSILQYCGSGSVSFWSAGSGSG